MLRSFETLPELTCMHTYTFMYDSVSPPCFGISNAAGKLAISFYGSVIIIDYVNQKCKSDIFKQLVISSSQYIKENNLTITDIARLDTLSIWATASVDNYVRIRDDYGSIIRFLYSIINI